MVSLSSGIPGGKCLQIFANMADTALHVPAEARHAFTLCDNLGEAFTLCDILGGVFALCDIFWEVFTFCCFIYDPPLNYILNNKRPQLHLVGQSQCQGCEKINVRAHIALSLSLASQHCN